MNKKNNKNEKKSKLEKGIQKPTKKNVKNVNKLENNIEAIFEALQTNSSIKIEKDTKIQNKTTHNKLEIPHKLIENYREYKTNNLLLSLSLEEKPIKEISDDELGNEIRFQNLLFSFTKTDNSQG